jgi:hypothetical protein
MLQDFHGWIFMGRRWLSNTPRLVAWIGPLRVSVSTAFAFALGRNFAIEPILLISQRAPRRLHPLVAVERGLVGRTLRQVRAVIGIFPKDL